MSAGGDEQLAKTCSLRLLRGGVVQILDAIGVPAAIPHLCLYSQRLSRVRGSKFDFDDVADAQLDSGEDGQSSIAHVSSTSVDDLGCVQGVPEDQANRNVDLAPLPASLAGKAHGGLRRGEGSRHGGDNNDAREFIEDY